MKNSQPVQCSLAVSLTELTILLIKYVLLPAQPLSGGGLCWGTLRETLREPWRETWRGTWRGSVQVRSVPGLVQFTAQILIFKAWHWSRTTWNSPLVSCRDVAREAERLFWRGFTFEVAWRHWPHSWIMKSAPPWRPQSASASCCWWRTWCSSRCSARMSSSIKGTAAVIYNQNTLSTKWLH